MAYGIFDLVVEIGSSLGLWIGLSALGKDSKGSEIRGYLGIRVFKLLGEKGLHFLIIFIRVADPDCNFLGLILDLITNIFQLR